MPFVYLLRCRDGSLYAGAAVDLDKRLAEHRAGRAARYTRSRLPFELVWSRELATWSDALRAEARLKRLRREEKLALFAPGLARDPLEATARLARRETLSLLVTDSGLGGLAVVAEIERRARASGRYRALELSFVSALPETGRGYNKMPSRERKLAVLEAALSGMLRGARADALLVACNTLSVLLPSSAVLAVTPLPVLGIVESGVAAIAERLAEDQSAVAAIFGTETTLAAGAHRAGLLARGIAPERILELPCPGLASRIELEGASEGVANEIERLVGAVARGAAPAGRLVAALCCSHYGYCAPQFSSALERAGRRNAVLVDPNRRLAGLFFPADESATEARARSHPEIRVRVVSRAVPLAAELESTARLLEPVSPVTAAALRGYELRRDLFPFKDQDD